MSDNFMLRHRKLQPGEITLTETLWRMGIGHVKFYQLVDSGKISGERRGRKWHVDEASVDSYIEQHGRGRSGKTD